MSRWIGNILLVLVVLVSSAWLYSQGRAEARARRQQFAHAIYSNCRSTEYTKGAIRSFVLGAYNQAERDLHTRGSAGYAYYRKHPHELRRAIASLERAKAQTRKSFPARHCPFHP